MTDKKTGKKRGKKGGKKIMMKIVATNVVASRPPNGDRLQRRPLVPISLVQHSWQPQHEIASHIY